MLGIVVLAVAGFVAAFAISTYEAWWTIGLVAVGVIVLGVERSSLRGSDAVRIGGGLIGSILLAAAGGWMVLLGMWGDARPCDACFDSGVLLLPGLAVLVAAIVVTAICIRSLIRALAQPSGDVPR